LRIFGDPARFANLCVQSVLSPAWGCVTWGPTAAETLAVA
jgi:hypothetical protein